MINKLLFVLIIPVFSFGQTFDWSDFNYYTTNSGSQAVTSTQEGLIANIYHTHPDADLIVNEGFIFTEFQNSSNQVVLEFINGVANIDLINLVSKTSDGTRVRMEFYREDDSYIGAANIGSFEEFTYSPYSSFGQGILQIKKVEFDFEDNNWMMGAIGFNNSALSISDFDNIEFYIHPNPVSDLIYIHGLVSKDVIIYSILGKKVLKTSNQNTIDVSSLSKGVYFIKVSDGVNTLTKKFIKN